MVVQARQTVQMQLPVHLGPWNLKMMLKDSRRISDELGFLGKGNCSDEAPLIEQVKAGTMGLKIHEDWGATPGYQSLSECGR